MSTDDTTPEEACRAITRSLMPLTDFPRFETPAEFCNLVLVLANDEETWERARHALAAFAFRAEAEARAQSEAIDRALTLARRATPEGHEHHRRVMAGEN